MEPSPGKEGAGPQQGWLRARDRRDQGPEGALRENPRGLVRPRGSGLRARDDYQRTSLASESDGSIKGSQREESALSLSTCQCERGDRNRV